MEDVSDGGGDSYGDDDTMVVTDVGDGDGVGGYDYDADVDLPDAGVDGDVVCRDVDDDSVKAIGI